MDKPETMDCVGATMSVLGSLLFILVDWVVGGSDARGTPPPAPVIQTTGMTGYLHANLSPQPAGFTFGFSTFAAIYTLNQPPAAHTQLGWGTWIIPDNRAVTQPLCPVGTMARDNWPERGPSYRDVFQTIEGGPGQWTTTGFPSSEPKFRINSTPDCYTTEVASTGWSFYQQPLPKERLGLAQLSNRLLTPPDGLTFTGTTTPGWLGYGWIALPLIPASRGLHQRLTGDQSWTLFLTASDFTGPVAFYTPEFWTEVGTTSSTGESRGLDAQPIITGGVALEVGNTPMLTGRDRSGRRYRRIPRLTFPVDSLTRRAILHQQVRYYAKRAIWDAVQDWMDHGVVASRMDPAGSVAPTLLDPGVSLSLGGAPADLGALLQSVVTSTGEEAGWGLEWTRAAPLDGALPEYYREEGGRWLAVPRSEVPAETRLSDQVFPPPPRRAPPPAPSRLWRKADWRAGPFSVTLSDRSTVRYVWYRFVDQPAIARLRLPDPLRTRLQAFVESLHAHSGTAGVSIAPPPGVGLATLDAALLVTPPPGLEHGYVPVVIGQR